MAGTSSAAVPAASWARGRPAHRWGKSLLNRAGAPLTLAGVLNAWVAMVNNDDAP
jgi:hypothetical protein